MVPTKSSTPSMSTVCLALTGVLPMGADQNRGSRDLFGQGLGRMDLGGHRLDERQGEVIQGGLDRVVAAAECVVHGAA
jgi:hypothetical protein